MQQFSLERAAPSRFTTQKRQSFLTAPLLSLIAMAIPVPASAEQASSEPPESAEITTAPHALRNTGALFLALEFTGSVASFAVLSEAAGKPAEACGWCETNAFDRAIRNVLLARNPRVAATASHVFSVGVAPVLAMGAVTLPAFSAGEPSYALSDAVIVLNGFLFSTGVVDFTKKITNRERPAFHYGVERATEAHPSDRFLSFYSGDTAWAFSLASSATALSYLRGYESAPYVALGGAAVGIAAGTLRIAADMHWTTDVLAGALMGTATGALFPLAFHRRERKSLGFLPIPRASRTEIGIDLVLGGF